ncbi:hypothetical protein FHW89_001425 [Mucilaginibacter sp. SG564]|nr:hypothetical protein [Mucilaginibacter sp. SG564]
MYNQLQMSDEFAATASGSFVVKIMGYKVSWYDATSGTLAIAGNSLIFTNRYILKQGLVLSKIPRKGNSANLYI